MMDPSPANLQSLSALPGCRSAFRSTLVTPRVRIPSPASSLVAALTLLATAAPSLSAQAAGQPPANYKGPTLFGVCVYISGDTSYYSNIFSISGYFKFKAQEAFQQYATSHANGAPLKGAGCRWSTSQEEVTTQKDADKRLLGLAGRSAKGVETGWTYNAATAANASTPAATRTAMTNTANNGVASRTRTTGSGTAAAQTTNQTANTQTSANGQTTANTGSIASSTEQTMQDSLAASKSSATSAVNDTVATTMGTVSAGASNAIKGLFNHKAKAAPAAADQQASAAAPANGQNPAPLGLQSTESPQAATAEAQHIEGLVADVAGNDIIINVGTQAGVHPGTKLAVMHPVRTVKDPATGKVLRTVEDKVGELTIKNSDATSAAGTFSGSTPARVGDTVRTPAAQ